MSNPGPASTSTDTFVGGGTAARIGNSATDKAAFFGVTPVSQAAYVAPVSTSAAVSGAYGFTSTQAAALIAAVNSLLAANEAIGIMAQS